MSNYRNQERKQPTKDWYKAYRRMTICFSCPRKPCFRSS